MGTEYGWEWTGEPGSFVPSFTVEPDIKVIESLARHHLYLPPQASCSVAPHAEGGFNKVFKVTANGLDYAMRVGIPLEAPYKVMSEVATIELLRSRTSIPVPRVFAYDATTQNDLRFPWILMQFVHGDTLQDRFSDMSIDQKSSLTRQVAAYHAELFRLRFLGVGSIYQTYDSGLNDPCGEPWSALLWVVLVIVGFDPALALSLSLVDYMWSRGPSAGTASFHIGRLTDNPIPTIPTQLFRGPYRHGHEWLSHRLGLSRHRQSCLLTNRDEETVLQAQTMLVFIDRIIRLLDSIMPPDEHHLPAPTIIRIHDMNSRNNMLGEDGNITSILDWEFIVTAPIPIACHLPRFLESDELDRSQPPRKSNHPWDWKILSNGTFERKPKTPDNGYYDEELWEWEKVLLRKLFLDEMQKLEPDWVEQHKARAIVSDYLQLVESAGWGIIYDESMNEWLDMVENGAWREGFLDGTEKQDETPGDNAVDAEDGKSSKGTAQRTKVKEVEAEEEEQSEDEDRTLVEDDPAHLAQDGNHLYKIYCDLG